MLFGRYFILSRGTGRTRPPGGPGLLVVLLGCLASIRLAYSGGACLQNLDFLCLSISLSPPHPHPIPLLLYYANPVFIGLVEKN